MAYDTLLHCPTNLRECLDWMDCIEIQGKAEKLAEAVEKLIRVKDVNTAGLSSLIPELARGLALFMGYPECVCKLKESVNERLERFSRQLYEDFRVLKDCLTKEDDIAACTCDKKGIWCKCCVLKCISKEQDSHCKCVKNHNSYGCTCSSQGAKKCCLDFIADLRDCLSLLDLQDDLEACTCNPSNQSCKDGKCNQSCTSCPLCKPKKDSSDSTMTGLGLGRPNPMKLAEKLEKFFGDKSQGTCDCKCNGSNTSCCCLACEDGKCSEHCACSSLKVTCIAKPEKCPRKTFCEAIQNVKVLVGSKYMTCCESGGKCHCEVDSGSSGQNCQSGQKCCVESVQVNDSNHYYHSVKCSIRRLLTFFKKVRENKICSKACCELLCARIHCWALDNLFNNMKKRNCRACQKNRVGTPCKGSKLTFSTNAKCCKGTHSDCKPDCCVGCPDCDAIKLHDALKKSHFAGPCAHEFFRTLYDFIHYCRKIFFPYVDGIRKAVQKAKDKCTSCCQPGQTCSSGSDCAGCKELPQPIVGLLRRGYVSSYAYKHYSYLDFSAKERNATWNDYADYPPCYAKMFLGLVPGLYSGLKVLYDRTNDHNWRGWIEIKSRTDLGKFLEASGFNLDMEIDATKEGFYLSSLLDRLFNGSNGSGIFDKVYEIVSQYFVSKFPSSSPSSQPETVRSMLAWLCCLPFSPQFEALKGYIPALCDGVYVDAEDLLLYLHATCALTPRVLSTIESPDGSKASLLHDFYSSRDLYYPEDPYALIETLCDYVHKVFSQFNFLRLQCGNFPLAAGWKYCDYGYVKPCPLAVTSPKRGATTGLPVYLTAFGYFDDKFGVTTPSTSALFRCPSDLKESIDWVLRVCHPYPSGESYYPWLHLLVGSTTTESVRETIGSLHGHIATILGGTGESPGPTMNDMEKLVSGLETFMGIQSNPQGVSKEIQYGLEKVDREISTNITAIQEAFKNLTEDFKMIFEYHVGALGSGELCTDVGEKKSVSDILKSINENLDKYHTGIQSAQKVFGTKPSQITSITTITLPSGIDGLDKLKEFFDGIETFSNEYKTFGRTVKEIVEKIKEDEKKPNGTETKTLKALILGLDKLAECSKIIVNLQTPQACQNHVKGNNDTCVLNNLDELVKKLGEFADLTKDLETLNGSLSKTVKGEIPLLLTHPNTKKYRYNVQQFPGSTNATPYSETFMALTSSGQLGHKDNSDLMKFAAWIDGLVGMYDAKLKLFVEGLEIYFKDYVRPDVLELNEFKLSLDFLAELGGYSITDEFVEGLLETFTSLVRLGILVSKTEHTNCIEALLSSTAERRVLQYWSENHGRLYGRIHLNGSGIAKTHNIRDVLKNLETDTSRLQDFKLRNIVWQFGHQDAINALKDSVKFMRKLNDLKTKMNGPDTQTGELTKLVESFPNAFSILEALATMLHQTVSPNAFSHYIFLLAELVETLRKNLDVSITTGSMSPQVKSLVDSLTELTSNVDKVDKFIRELQNGYVFSYPPFHWAQCSENVPSHVDQQCSPDTLAKMFLGTVPLIFSGLSFIQWRCENRWKGKDLSDPEVSAFFESMGYEGIMLNANKKGSTISPLLTSILSDNSSPLRALYSLVTEHFRPPSSPTCPLPTTIRGILHWLSLVPFSEYYESMFQVAKKLCDASQRVDVSPLGLRTHLSSAMVPGVLMSIEDPDRSDALFVYKVYTCSEYFHYPSDPSEFFYILVENSYKAYVQLRFLTVQCHRKANEGGWKDCVFGNGIPMSDSQRNALSLLDIREKYLCRCGSTSPPCVHPLQAYLTGHASSLFRGFLPMGFGLQCVRSSSTGQGIYNVVKHFCGPRNPFTVLCRDLLCISVTPPETLGDILAFLYQLARKLNANHTPAKRTSDTMNLKDSFDREIFLEPGHYDPGKLTGALSTALAKKHSKMTNGDSHTNDFLSIMKCNIPNCAMFLLPLTKDVFSSYSHVYARNYISWICHLAPRLHSGLQELQRDLQSHECCSAQTCPSVVHCPFVHPRLYSLGFTFNSPDSLTSKQCPEFYKQLCLVLKEGSPFYKLLEAIEEFIWSIRLPFCLFVFVFWDIVFLYYCYAHLYKLDTLHIRSHLHLSKSFKIPPSTLLSSKSLESRLPDLSYFGL